MNLQKFCLVIGAAIFMVMINIDYTAVNLALVTISKDIHSDLNVIQWLLSGYALAWAALVVPAGKLGDILGRKRACLFGLLLFTAGSIITGAGQTPSLVILGRIFQGMAAAFAIPAIYAFIHTSFPKEKMGVPLGILSLGIGLGMALGPTFGGIILTYLGWRWIFFLNAPISLVIFLLIYYATKEAVIAPNSRLDVISSSLLSLSIAAFFYAIAQIHRWDMLQFSSIVFVSLFIGVIFVWRQGKIAHPLLPLTIFSNRSFMGCVTTLAVEQFVFSATLVTTALFLQKVAGYSPLTSSYIFLALSLMTGVISPFGGYVVSHFGFKWPALLGLVCLIVGLFFLSQLSIHPSLTAIAVPLIIVGIGMGIALTALQTGVLMTVTEDEVSVASGLFVMFALIGNSLGVLVSATLYEVESKRKLAQLIAHGGHQVSIGQANQLQLLIAHVGAKNPNLSLFPTVMHQKVMQWLPYALNHGVAFVMIISILITAVSIVVCGLLV